MWSFVLKILVNLVTSETVKEVVKYGAKELVKRTDTGIDDALAENLLGDIKSSNRNKIKNVAIEEAVGYTEKIMKSGKLEKIYKVL